MLTRAKIIKINRQFRAKDESHLWPISGQFNATDRAIRRLQTMQRQGLVIDDTYSYKNCLEAEIVKIVNA